jgi:hypothetical protein
VTRNADISSKYRASDTYGASLTCCLVMAPICIASPRVADAHYVGANTLKAALTLPSRNGPVRGSGEEADVHEAFHVWSRWL